jgi:hypothetical protein
MADPTDTTSSKRKRDDEEVISRMTTSAYSVDALLHGNDVTAGNGPQCSPDEYCFWCVFQINVEEGVECLYSASKAIARININQNKELGHVVDLVYQDYETNIREEIEYANRRTGAIDESPKWSRASILRHLVYSREFQGAFDSMAEFSLRAMFCRLNENAIFTDTGEVNEKVRTAMVNTLTSITRWRNQK